MLHTTANSVGKGKFEKEQVLAKQQFAYTAGMATNALAGRKPKLKAKLKTLLELAAKANAVAEVMDVFSDIFSAANDDEDVFDDLVALIKMVKLYSSRGPCMANAGTLAALHACLSSVYAS